MYNRPLNRLTSFVKILIMVSLMGGIAACGGGGAKAPSTGQQPTGGVGTIPGTSPGASNTASSIQLLVGSQTMPSAGNVTDSLTTVVLNASGRALTDKLVDLVIVDPATGGKAFLTNVASKTNTEGLLIATLNLGTNKSNRTITVKAISDGVEASNTVDVTGTTVTISGATSLALTQSTPLTISLKDSAGNPLQGASITLASKSGNILTDLAGSPLSAPPTTNRSGQVVVLVRATVSGNDEISVSALGATNVANIIVSGSNFSFVSPSPATDTDIAVNISQTVKIRWIEGGVPQNGRSINFSATRGTLSSPSAVTDAAGDASVTIQSNAAGATTVQASAPSGTPSTTLNFVFVTTSATLVNVKADKTTVPVNTSGSDTSRAIITAVVRDGASNLVKNARVQFEIVSDTTGGTLSGTEDISDIAGEATVDYIAGTTSSANEGVVIKAEVVDVNGNPAAVPALGLSGTVSLTVAGQSLFIRLQTDNQVGGAAPIYSKKYVALVTDAAGNPVPNAKVQFEIRPAQPPFTAYAKGNFRVIGTVWRQQSLAECYNEDLNLNGVLDNLVSEDTNYNGILGALEDRDGNSKLNGVLPYGVDIGDTGAGLLPTEDDILVNSILDTAVVWDEDLNNNNVLDVGEDVNGNSTLDGALIRNEDGLLPGEGGNGNGVLDPAETLHTNGSGYVDTNEDFDRNGSLTPGNVVTVNTNVTADALGFAEATVAYARNFAFWVRVTLTAKITVAGSETTSSATFIPPGAADDYSDAAVAPPGQLSPFGARRNCKSKD